MSTATIESGTVITEATRAAWLAERRNVLGASEAAAALGICPYTTPIEKWQEKCGITAPTEPNEAMRWGSLLEPVILAEYERLTGQIVAGRQFFLRHPDHPFLAATLDGIAGDSKLVEVKTTSAWSKGWGDEDSDELPDSYRVQIHQQFAVTGATEADLVVLVGGQRLKVYPVARDEDLVRAVVQGCVGFWGCVESRTPPTHGRLTAQALAVLHPGCAGRADWSAADAETVRVLVEQVGEETRALKALEESIADSKALVLKALGGAAFGLLPDGRTVKRYLREMPPRQVSYTTKAYTENSYRVLKGKP